MNARYESCLKDVGAIDWALDGSVDLYHLIDCRLIIAKAYGTTLVDAGKDFIKSVSMLIL